MGDPDRSAVVSLTAQIACIKREIAMRERVYPRWVHAKRMTEAAAVREQQAMQAVLETLERLQHGQDPFGA